MSCISKVSQLSSTIPTIESNYTRLVLKSVHIHDDLIIMTLYVI